MPRSSSAHLAQRFEVVDGLVDGLAARSSASRPGGVESDSTVGCGRRRAAAEDRLALGGDPQTLVPEQFGELIDRLHDNQEIINNGCQLPTWCCYLRVAPSPNSRRSGLELGHGGAGVLLPQCLQLRVAGVTFGVPLVGETTRRDVVDQSPHRGGEVEVVVLAPPGELAVLARRRVVAELRGVPRLADEPHRPLDFAGEDQLGEDGFERDALLQHHLHERRVHRGEGGRQSLLDPEVEHGLLPGRELHGALSQPADGLRDRERAFRAEPVASRCTPTAVMNPTPSS